MRIVPILFLVACAGGAEVKPTEVSEPETRTVSLHFMAPEAGASGAAEVGCGETMVPVEVTIAAGTPREELEATIGQLLVAEDREGMSNAARGVFTATVSEDGEDLILDLQGKPEFGGICAVPRLKAPVEATVKPFGATITLNGSEAAWRCLGDESGTCM